MKPVFYIIIILFVSSFMSTTYGQELEGKNLNEIKDRYDSYYVFPNEQSGLKRTVLSWMDENGYRKYKYCYTDGSGIIKIELISPYIFADEEYKWVSYQIDTNLMFSLSDFREGLACIRNLETDLLGFIDTTGRIIIEPQYNDIGSFSEGLAFFAILNRCFGREAIPNQVGYIDKMNQKVIVLPDKYSFLYSCCYFQGSSFTNGVAIMKMKENGADCNCYPIIVINKKGKVLNIWDHLFDKDGNYVPLE